MKVNSTRRFCLLMAFFFLVGAVLLQPLFGQSTTTGTTTGTTGTTTTGQGIDLNQILQAIGGLGGLSGLTGNVPNPGNGINTGTTTPPTTSQPSSGGFTQPAIVTNQFNTTQGSSLAARAPGLMVQQGIAETQGKITITGQPDTPDWLQETGHMIALAIVNEVQGVLTTINTSIAALSGLNVATSQPATGTTSSTITNPATTGAGTSTPIDKSLTPAD